jgi:hypothetical protein
LFDRFEQGDPSSQTTRQLRTADHPLRARRQCDHGRRSVRLWQPRYPPSSSRAGPTKSSTCLGGMIRRWRCRQWRWRPLSRRPLGCIAIRSCRPPPPRWRYAWRATQAAIAPACGPSSEAESLPTSQNKVCPRVPLKLDDTAPRVSPHGGKLRHVLATAASQNRRVAGPLGDGE